MLRIILATILLWVLACVPAFADYAASRAWFNAMGDDRFNLRFDLILAGFYTGFVDGAFDTATYKALTDFEETLPVTPDGVLEPGDIAALHSIAIGTFSRLGFERRADARAGIEIWLPAALLTRQSPQDYGTLYFSDDRSYALATLFQPASIVSLDGVIAWMVEPRPGRTLTYQLIAEDFAIIAAEIPPDSEDRRFEYMFMMKVPGGVAGFRLMWGEQDQQTGSIIGPFMAGDVLALDPPTNLPPEPRDNINSNAPTQQFGSFHMDRNDPALAVFTGPITPGAPLDFRRLVAAYPDIRTIDLDSPGGDVATALQLAYQIHEAGYRTRVPDGARCLSACAFLLFAGTPRHAHGQLGVHQVWPEAGDNAAIERTISDIVDALETFGVDGRVISAMLETGPDEMYVFTRDELLDWGIVGLGPARFREQALLLQESAPGVTGTMPVEGVVNWHAPADSGPGEPLFAADVRFPGAHFEMSISFYENTEAELPASHVFNIAFEAAPGFSGGAVASIDGILAKSELLMPGTALAGAPARTPENRFQYYLSDDGADLLANFALLLEEDFLDLTLTYEDGRQAVVILTTNETVRAHLAKWGGVSTHPATR